VTCRKVLRDIVDEVELLRWLCFFYVFLRCVSSKRKRQNRPRTVLSRFVSHPLIGHAPSRFRATVAFRSRALDDTTVHSDTIEPRSGVWAYLCLHSVFWE
jgi:hypothetical protein